ncbi:MAG: hypothetical protein V3S02_04225 [Dehalococcoidales bacterium]
MEEFPPFMRNPANKIAGTAQFTRGIQGYVYDGADDSQMAFWTNPDGESPLNTPTSMTNI